MCEAMANARPVSRQGAQQAYHAVTFGWVVGEIACRLSGRPFGPLLLEEICRPLGMTDLFTGIPDAVAPRMAVLEEIFEPGKEPPADDTKPQNFPGWMQPLHTMMNRPDMGPRNLAFGHGGYGGSIGFADPEIRLGVALTKNLFSAKGAGGRVLTELRAAVVGREVNNIIGQHD